MGLTNDYQLKTFKIYVPWLIIRGEKWFIDNLRSSLIFLASFLMDNVTNNDFFIMSTCKSFFSKAVEFCEKRLMSYLTQLIVWDKILPRRFNSWIIWSLFDTYFTHFFYLHKSNIFSSLLYFCDTIKTLWPLIFFDTIYLSIYDKIWFWHLFFCLWQEFIQTFILLWFWHNLIQTFDLLCFWHNLIQTFILLWFWHNLIQTFNLLCFWHNLIQTFNLQCFWHNLIL